MHYPSLFSTFAAQICLSGIPKFPHLNSSDRYLLQDKEIMSMWENKFLKGSSVSMREDLGVGDQHHNLHKFMKMRRLQ